MAVALVGVVSGCGGPGGSAAPAGGSGSAARRTAANHSVAYGVPAGNGLAERQAADDATNAYHASTGTAVSTFVADLNQLDADVGAGDVGAAQRDELAAQGAFDSLRFLMAWNSPTALALDGLPSAVPPGQSFTGLHLVEQELWSGGDARAAAAGLLGEAPLVEELLSRMEVAPQGILTVAVKSLDWADDVAVPGREEVFSHDDAVDVEASVAAARSAFAAVEPLCMLVAPTRAAGVSRGFAELTPLVASLGSPGTVADASIPVTTWRAVSEQADAVAGMMSALAPSVAGLGPPTIYGYVA